jgi:tetratricopeptide (TPR) repeat protein
MAAALRYRAFLSYSHRDSAVTLRLHRRLEGYRVPRALSAADGRALPSRLHPVFRDRDELASATQLSDSIERALDESAALVVVCSPAAVASPWVDAEIAYFRRRHPQRPVFAFVVAGDPGRDPRRDPARAALPLRLLLRDPDVVDGALGEPLAADARDEADGFTSAFFKLAAGLLGVRYDDLRRRDQRRRQQRWALASGSALLLALLFALLAWDATRARDAARAAQARAELELRSERQTREFLLSVFHLADAGEARGERVTAREVLDRAVGGIDRARFDRPALRARYLATMGQAYTSLGLYRRGEALLQQSIEGLAAATDPDAREQRIESRIQLAHTLFDMGRYDDALAQIEAFEREEPMATPLQRSRLLGVQGDLLTYLERDAEASAAFDQALALLPQGGSDSVDAALARARSLFGNALIALFNDDAAAAQRGFAAAVALLQEAVGEDHPRTISARISLGSAAYRNGERAPARDKWQAGLADAERVYDPDSPLIGTTKNNLGLLLLEDGQLDAAEPLLRDALASDRRHRSDTFDDLAYPLHNLGYLLLVSGRTEEAATLLQEGLAIADASSHRMLGPLLTALADLSCERGDPAGGRALAERAVAVTAEAGDSDAWRAAQARLTLAWCRAQAGEPVGRNVAASDLAELQSRWEATSPFLQRARQQVDALR